MNAWAGVIERYRQFLPLSSATPIDAVLSQLGL